MSDDTTLASQTEGTGLAVAIEDSLGSTTVPEEGWETLQPNSFGEFGATFKKMPRDPITASLQMQKGMLVGEESGIAFEVDATMDAIDKFAEMMFRSVKKHGGNTGQSRFAVSSVTGTGYTVDADGDLTAKSLIVARGFDTDANNGLKEVGAGSTDTETKVASLTAEASPPSNARIDFVGWRGAAGDLFLDTSGYLKSTVANFTLMGLQEFQWVYIGGESSDNRFATPEYFGACRIAAGGIAAHQLTFDMWSWDVEAFAELDLATVATLLDTVVQAQTSGSGGDAITVRTLADGTPAVKSELDLDGPSTNIDTIIRAKFGGTDGDDITVEIVSGAPTAAGVLTEVGTHVKLAIKVTATATTVGDLETLIGSSTLIEVKTAGTAITSLTAGDVFASVPLAGGADADAASVSEISNAVTLHYTPGFTTVAELEAVITADSTKIEVKRAGTPTAVLTDPDDTFVATNLDGGSDGDDDGAGKRIDLYFSRFLRNVAMGHADFRKPSACFEVTYPELYEGQPGYEYILGNMLDSADFNIPLGNKATISLGFKGTRTLAFTDTRKTGPSDAIDPVTNLGVSTATDLQRLRMEDEDHLGISSSFTSAKLAIKNNISPEPQLGVLGARIMNQGKHQQMFEGDVIFTSSDKMDKDKSIKVSSKSTGFQHPKSGSTGSLSLFGYLPPLPAEE